MQASYCHCFLCLEVGSDCFRNHYKRAAVFCFVYFILFIDLDVQKCQTNGQ